MAKQRRLPSILVRKFNNSISTSEVMRFENVIIICEADSLVEKTFVTYFALINENLQPGFWEI